MFLECLSFHLLLMILNNDELIIHHSAACKIRHTELRILNAELEHTIMENSI